ncbi:MAG: tRNA (adenosine(37)-N6)-threonylcarbamoyltransferase complex ATPase subunit type 1 TsaE [Leptospira sp.]|jgi:tRNA threonylcarbamoyladenosine biosynthesis protein TsaE|nr:tRNA (adenosine(37)-N6)-threonylcarbamoyltransferase complex ATPase subunit type 1 TsaE [Leptospira sp.]NCS93705.1 tRNA (adenosine(37)-N6)-threonylcarbamoyltransferase complex ATPase subunit type 1 TsaE [Leptospira sp.]
MRSFSNIKLENYKPIFEAIQKKYLNQDTTTIITLSGEMGAGKTTFTRQFLQYLGTQDIVNSPTFSLLNEYKLLNGKEIFHFDLYRLQNSSEIDELGFDAIWGKQGISIIEWWQKADEIIPYPRVHIEITLESSETRKLTIERMEEEP